MRIRLPIDCGMSRNSQVAAIDRWTTIWEGNAMLKRAIATVAVAALIGMSASAAWSQQDIRWGTPPVGTAGHKAAGRAGQSSEQGDAAVPHLGAADRRRHRHRQGLRHQGARRLLRLRRRLPRARDRLRPLQGLQGARPAHADPVVLVEHDRDRPRDPRRATRTRSRNGATSTASACSPGRCRSTPAPRPSARWPRSASSSPTCRSIWRPSARSSSPARSTP